VTIRVGISAAFLAAVAFPAHGDAIEFRRTEISLPAAPSRILSADLDGDGRRDLLAIVAHTRWGQVSSDRVEDAVMITEVVPALFERLEARAWLGEEGGGFVPVAAPLPLDASVHAIDEGENDLPVFVIRDGGLWGIRAIREEGGAVLRAELLREEAGAFDGSEAFLPTLRLTADVDRDGLREVLLPGRRDLLVLRARRDSVAGEPLARLALPGDRTFSGLGATRVFLLPTVEDATGDGTLDLVAVEGGMPPVVWIAEGKGGGRFAPFRVLPLDCLPLGKREAPALLSHFGDLDGDGLPEVVLRKEVDSDRGQLKKVREPRWEYSFHRIRKGFEVGVEPYLRFEVPGYASSGGFTGDEPDFRDLDGDGRKDLVTLTLDFSVLQALRVLTTKRISIGVDFEVRVQQPDGEFRKAPNRGLDEKLKFDLDDLRVGRMAQFAGDFDGDGRIDFVHLGRGRTLTVHLGKPGGVYPEKPDLAVDLVEEPQDLALVQVRDLDGDGRADLAVTRVGTPEDEAVSAAARVELLLSGGMR
jgi:hypothetical protein